jgi:hypothetical protein
MPFTFPDLDALTRRYMIEEVEAATREGNLYFSKRFTSQGAAAWPALLREAAQHHTEHWLAYQIEARRLMTGLEGSRTPSGGYTIKHVPHTAPETQAEGQFNRYYILGVCRRATAENNTEVVIYRAKEVMTPRPESQALIGARLDPSDLIAQLRPVHSSLSHELLKPNSGLSVHL